MPTLTRRSSTSITLLLLAMALLVMPASWLLSAAVAPSTAPAVATRPQVNPAFHIDLRQSVEYLASDDLDGRMIGTPGIEKAAGYIADNFLKLGLKPLPGLNGYFQPFRTTTRVEPDRGKSSLSLGGSTLKLGDEFLPLRASAEKTVSGPVQFAGYGIDDPSRNDDDYAGIDPHGKIVLIMRFEPHTPQGKSVFAGGGDEWSKNATIPRKIEAAVAHGAAGIILVNPATFHDDDGLIPFDRRLGFNAPVPVAQISVSAADAVLKLAGAPDLRSLQTKVDQTRKSVSFSLTNISARLSVAFKRTEKQIENVAAMLPGEGPAADQYVVIGAHYDHLGHGGPGSLAPWSHGIHHGADDNASGTAAMMAIADRFVHLGPQPRTLIFIAFTGEEEGLLGSEYFVSHSPVRLDQIVSMLNLDMVGRVRNDQLLIGGEGTAADFPKLIEKADEGLPFKLGEFGRGGIGPSDHTSFALHKIPVLFFFSGLHMDYHRPTDTADKINYAGMKDVVSLGVKVVQAMTTMPRPKYNASYDASGMAQMTGPGSSHGSHASLGAIPDYSQGEDATGGMRIGGIMPGSPSDKAGLRQGDIVARFGDTPINNMIDYTNALGKAKPGQPIKLKIIREGKPLEVEATPVAKKD